MSDARLRELERRWRESGAIEDEAAYLHERMRVGALPPAKLTSAALCRHPAALIAAFGSSRVRPRSIENLMRSLRSLSQEAFYRAVVAVAYRMLEYSATDEMTTDISRSMVQSLTKRVLALYEKLDPFVVHRMTYPSALIARPVSTAQANSAGNALAACFSAFTQRDPPIDRLVRYARRAAGRANVRQAIHDDILAWALGTDPLPARCAELKQQRRYSP